jgi:hypothetical protein
VGLRRDSSDWGDDGRMMLMMITVVRAKLPLLNPCTCVPERQHVEGRGWLRLMLAGVNLE